MLFYPTAVSRNYFDRDLTHLFSHLFSENAFDGKNEETKRFWNPVCEMDENEGHYLVTLEIPGVSKEEIKLEVEGDKLVITGEKKEQMKKGDVKNWYTERRFGKFQRSFSLPQGTDVTKIEAKHKEGLLYIQIPKPEKVKAHQVKIENYA